MAKTHRNALVLTEEGVISGLFLASANTEGAACAGNLRYVLGTGFVMRGVAGKIALGGSGMFLHGGNTTTPSITGQVSYVSGMGFVANTQDGLIGIAPRETAVTAITASAGGIVPAGASFVEVLGGTDNGDIITLPAPVVGHEVTLKVADTGYELRSSTPASIMINGGSGTNAECAIAAKTMTRCICVDSDSWFCYDITSAGTMAAIETAAA